jgi:two-component system, chemotaxis family, sensor histidine kinase and response regulator WspE
MTRQGPDLSAMSMRELLRLEVDTQSRVLIDKLLELEHAAADDKMLEALMRAAHSIKGGARIADLPAAVELAHVIEDLFVAMRAGRVSLHREGMDTLLKAVDLLIELAHTGAVHDDLPDELVARSTTMHELVLALSQSPAPRPEAEIASRPVPAQPAAPVPADASGGTQSGNARTVRVSIERMNRLMSLVGELSVKDRAAAWIRGESLQARRRLREAMIALESLRGHLGQQDIAERWLLELDEVAAKLHRADDFVTRSGDALEVHDAHTASITGQLQREVIAHRMQPFGEGLHSFGRLVRDLSQTLGKQVILEVSGNEVGVDRDILERLNTPLTHLIQNAIDHGIESPATRIAAGKPAAGTIRLSAQHRGGLLSIVLEDDGRGIDLEKIRQTVIDRKLVSEGVAASLEEQELIEFLFLPNFTLSQQLSNISGRGVGLDLVRHTLQETRGSIRLATQAGRGVRIEITLPVTLIVLRCLIVAIAGELFALPTGRIARALKVGRSQLLSMENRQYVMLDGHQTGLVSAAELMQLSGEIPAPDELSVVVLTKGHERYGLVVERFIGERQLVERPLDPRLGLVEGVASASLQDDGVPVLILDVDDMLHAIDRLVSGRSLRRVGEVAAGDQASRRKRVLVVDDSITVREVERGLLSLKGYAVDVAVDGVEGWNALRSTDYDLAVVDVDMPRMNGIELIRLIRADARLQKLSVIIVSYKDREEDLLTGLEAGADRYLTKGSFQDDTFVHTVASLIGEP